LVTVAFGLRNVADTDQGIREMTRVCLPGGKVAILEFSMPRWQPFKAIYGFYFRNVLPKIGQWLARNREDAYAYLPESVGQFPSGEELAERMRDAGLSNVRFYPLTLGIATLYVGTKATGSLPSAARAGEGGGSLGVPTLCCVVGVSSWRFVWFKMREAVKVCRFGVWDWTGPAKLCGPFWHRVASVAAALALIGREYLLVTEWLPARVFTEGPG